MKIGYPSLPFRGIRGTDKYGSGVFLASRDGGKRAHLGRDYIALPGDTALFPIHGIVEKVGLAYIDSTLGSIHIRGVGEHRGLLVKLLYASCNYPVGYEGQMGDALGTVQSLETKYPGISNHVHCEVWAATDPHSLMAASHPEFGGPIA